MTQLKQQAKHMYAIMTEYYGENADLAIALKMSRSSEFIKQLNEEKLELGVIHKKGSFFSSWCNDV